jgi:hypothetical protein
MQEREKIMNINLALKFISEMRLYGSTKYDNTHEYEYEDYKVNDKGEVVERIKRKMRGEGMQIDSNTLAVELINGVIAPNQRDFKALPKTTVQTKDGRKVQVDKFFGGTILESKSEKLFSDPARQFLIKKGFTFHPFVTEYLN